jgi:hypothetical protein
VPALSGYKISANSKAFGVQWLRTYQFNIISKGELKIQE